MISRTLYFDYSSLDKQLSFPKERNIPRADLAEEKLNKQDLSSISGQVVTHSCATTQRAEADSERHDSYEVYY